MLPKSTFGKIVYLAIGCFSLVPVVSGFDIAWNNIDGGSFHDGDNWDPQQVPGPDDHAIFDLMAGSPYTVDFSEGAATNQQASVYNDTLILDLAGSTYSLTGVGGYGLAVGVNTADMADLSLTGGGTVACANSGVLGMLEGASGFMVVEGANTLWRMYDENDAVSPWRDLYVGQEGLGELTVRDGGRVETGQGWAGAWDQALGIVRVQDGGEFYVDGLFRVGAYGQGELYVEAGGGAEMGYCRMAEYSYSTATAEVMGGGAVWEITNQAVNENLIVGDGGMADLFVGNGGLLTAQRDIVVGAQDESLGQLSVGATEGQPQGGNVLCSGLIVGRDYGSTGFVNVNASEGSTSMVMIGRDYLTGQVIIGQDGMGSLGIGPHSEVLLPAFRYDAEHPEWVSSAWLTIGAGASSSGIVTIDGEGALLHIECAPLTVGGNSTDAALAVTNGGKLLMDNGELWAATGFNSSAMLFVTDGGVIDETSPYASVIGGLGKAEMYISDSRSDPVSPTVARFSHLILGQEILGEGLVEVSAARLEVAGDLIVGQLGSGTLNLRPSGKPAGIATVGTVDAETVPAGELHVGPDGLLGGTGLILGDVVCSGSFVKPGDRFSPLTIDGDYRQIDDGNLLMSIFRMGASSYRNTRLNLVGTGNVTLDGGGLILAFNNYFPQEGDTFDIITFTGSILTPEVDWFDNVWIWGLDAYGKAEDWRYHFDLIGNGTGSGILRVVWDNPVPEPMTLGLLVLGGFVLFKRRGSA